MAEAHREYWYAVVFRPEGAKPSVSVVCKTRAIAKHWQQSMNEPSIVIGNPPPYFVRRVKLTLQES